MSMLLAVSVGSIAVIAYEGYRSGRNAIRSTVVNQLVSVRASKASQIENYFRSLRNEVQVVGHSPSTITAMKEFSTAFSTVLAEAADTEAAATSGNIRQYYRDEFASRLAENTSASVDADTFLPASTLARYLQTQYIVSNPNPVGEKEKLDDADDGTQYSTLHERYHPIFRDIVEEFGYYDLFLIDNDGNIVYSVFKEVDFATSLRIGPYARSSLANAYRDAQKQNSSYIALSDFAAYTPSYEEPAAFMATPLYDGTELVGVLAIQVSVDEVNEVMTSDGNWSEEGLGETGETFLVGADQTLRSDSRLLIESPEEYFAALTRQQVDPATIEAIESLNTSVLNQPATSDAVKQALEGRDGVETVVNYVGERVISAYAPLNIRGVDWAIISEIDEAEIFTPITKFAQNVLIASAIAVFLITLASLWLAKSFLKPVTLLGDGFRKLAKGHKEVTVPVLASDELGELAKAFNHMVKKNRKTSELVFQKTQETESLLLNMFPESVAKRLKRGEKHISDEAESVAILFANVLNFQRLTEELKPKKAIEILNEIVSAMDDATEQHGIEKIKTTGSEYLAVSGLSVARLDQTKRVIDFAIEAMRIVSQVNREYDTDLQMRVGVHSGSVMAGTVGSQRLIYDIWGDTVVMAHYVQSAAAPNSIFVSKPVANSLVDLYEFEPAGEVDIRGTDKISVLRVKL
ncbi:MAG: adenylate/guanylate cyclase domain-containing protein [Cyanobacteria bacterium J06581_3]